MSLCFSVTARNFRTKGQHGKCKGSTKKESLWGIKKPEYNKLHANLELKTFMESANFYNYESLEEFQTISSL